MADIRNNLKFECMHMYPVCWPMARKNIYLTHLPITPSLFYKVHRYFSIPEDQILLTKNFKAIIFHSMNYSPCRSGSDITVEQAFLQHEWVRANFNYQKYHLLSTFVLLTRFLSKLFDKTLSKQNFCCWYRANLLFPRKSKK